MPWVEAQVNSGIRMENAYTAMPWTTWVTRMIFTGETPISGKLYKRDIIGKNEGEYALLDYLKNHEYNVYYSCISSRGKKMLKKEYLCEPNDGYTDGMSTRYQWFGICKLLQHKEKNFVIIHNMVETHVPFTSMDLEYMEWRSLDRMTEKEKSVNRRFLDKRMEWYSKFYGDKTMKVWMSDHGPGTTNRDTEECKQKTTSYEMFEEKRTHVFVGVSGTDIKKKLERRYFGFDGFMQLIKYFVEKKESDYEKIFNPYVTYENYPTYGKSSVKEMINMSVEDLEKSKSKWQQFMGVRDEKYLYILYYDGSESFYVLPDEKTDELENPAYTDQLVKYRSLVDGRKFINIFEEDKFVHSRMLYEKIGVHEHIW
jgi:hypothetical protein